MKTLLALVAAAFLACAQPVVLHPPPPPVVVLKPYLESFPATTFAAPNSPIALAHVPDVGTVVTVTLRGGTLFLDQVELLKTVDPLTLTLDQTGLAGAVVTVKYYSSH